uniref:Uncharacterized protein n=1 Tax=Glossina austeni TaxID=7395 RepID=A0A1A9USL0_GLOAU
MELPYGLKGKFPLIKLLKKECVEIQVVLPKFVSEIDFRGMQRFSLNMEDFEKLTLLERRYHSMINVIVKDLNSFAFLLSKGSQIKEYVAGKQRHKISSIAMINYFRMYISFINTHELLSHLPPKKKTSALCNL